MARMPRSSLLYCYRPPACSASAANTLALALALATALVALAATPVLRGRVAGAAGRPRRRFALLLGLSQVTPPCSARLASQQHPGTPTPHASALPPRSPSNTLRSASMVLSFGRAKPGDPNGPVRRAREVTLPASPKRLSKAPLASPPPSPCAPWLHGSRRRASLRLELAPMQAPMTLTTALVASP
ncbi:hypothetical protein P171DRAFT_447805 [Karstenula rhodostoma CBS 690.94]|uniref:Uncharacterized protein n=1 Tax=Karstenula rhodostoma CBS 690.94 TaxID=1392251 RepID=A0A9P4U898_9PLEO|nr:hypothetical protein P171DRAFT_447805 [Karstenula rhodostoma CBS 690.94]